MEFHEILNEYNRRLDCAAKGLAERTGLSPATIGWFRSGSRKPDVADEQLKRLSRGIESIAKKQGLADLTEKAVLNTFKEVSDYFTQTRRSAI